MNWDEVRSGEWRCVNHIGMIVARITSHQGEYHLQIGGHGAGTFVSLDAAKQAGATGYKPIEQPK